jgi:hypothetical protein
MMEIPSLPSALVYVAHRDIDVKCGRGRECFQHPGNSLLRIRVAAKLEEYQNQFNGKLKVIIVNSVISQFIAEGARFLKRDPSTKLWYDGGIKAAKERVGSAFRDASRPNKVKCMEKLKAQMRSEGQLSQLLHPSPTGNDGISEPGPPSIFPGIAANSVDSMRTSALPFISRSYLSGMVEPRRYDSIWPEHDHVPYPGLILFNDAASDLSRFRQAVGDQTDDLHSVSHESHSTINMDDAKSVLHEISPDDGTFSTTLIEDIDDIDEHQPLTLEDKAFLAALNWEKDLS